MSTLNLIQSRGEVRHDVNERRHKASEPEVITGTQFRQLLGIGTDKFAALVKSGRVDHLRSVNVSALGHVVYVRAKVLAWIQETPAVALRPVSHKGRR